MDLNKGISTPIAILLIIAVSAVVGVAVWQFTKPAEQPAPEQASDYTTQSACKEADYYWYDDACHEEEQKEKSLSVISPNGGEVWEAGETYEIKWDNNSSEIEGVYLELYQDDKYIETNLKTEAPTTIEGGAYEWTIPEYLEEGDYKIKITGNTEEDTGIAEDFSDGTFKIKDKSPTEASLPEITSPNGGEKWKVGTNYDIEWNCPEDWMDNGNFSIYVANDSGSEEMIKSMATCSSERYTWKVGYNTEGEKVISPGGNFKIRLRAVAGAGELHNESDDYFTVNSSDKKDCTDSDGGKDYFEKGSTHGTMCAQGAMTRDWEDYCSDSNTLVEYYCVDSYTVEGPTAGPCEANVKSTSHQCSEGCENGACLGNE